MKIPRNVSGAHFAEVLCRRWQCRKVHQEGSHIILETSEPTHQRIAVPSEGEAKGVNHRLSNEVDRRKATGYSINE